MRIGIDISQIVYEGTGVARFTRGLVESILQYDTHNEWIFFLSSFRKKPDQNLLSKIQEKGHKIFSIPLPPTILSVLWNDLHIMNIDSLIPRLDWFITSDWTEPPAHIKKATIVHDLTFMRYPETVEPSIISVQQKRLNRVKAESQVIFADSQSTKDDLSTYLTLEDKRITINYPGVTTKKQSSDAIYEVLKKYKINKKFVLSVGKLEPRKNLHRLIDAFITLDNQEIELAIVGPKGWDKDTENQYKNVTNIKWLGYISDENLFALYQSALFFIFPSVWEGFGYPAVEAMQLGCPTALSNTSSLKELGNNASVLFDPWDVQSIKMTLHTLITDDTLRNELKMKGLKKADSFTWKKYFDTMIDVLQKQSTIQ